MAGSYKCCVYQNTVYEITAFYVLDSSLREQWKCFLLATTSIYTVFHKVASVVVCIQLSFIHEISSG